MEPTHPTEELFDVVNEADEVIDVLPRSVVHARKLCHRAVHVLVFNSEGELLIHQRSAQKDEEPLTWNSSCSGHVSAGEDYDLAARRELQEELGLNTTIEMIGQLPASPRLAYEHTRVYRAVTDQPPVFDPGEIAQGCYRTLPEIMADVAARPSVYSQPFRTILAWYQEEYLNKPSLKI